MGRHPKPSHIRLAEGNRGKRPVPVDPPTVAGVPECPAAFSKGQRAAWADLVRCVEPMGVVTTSDALGLERAAVALARVRSPRGNPLAAAAAEKLVLQYLGRFGLTPADRAKLGAAPEKPERASDFPEGLRHGA